MDSKFEERKETMQRLLTVVMDKWEENPGTWKEYVADEKIMSTFLKTAFNLRMGWGDVHDNWGYLSSYIQNDKTWNNVLGMFRTEFLKNIDFKDFQKMLHQHKVYRTKTAKLEYRDLPPELQITPTVSVETASLETNSTSNPDEVIAELHRKIFEEQEKSTALQKELDEVLDATAALQLENATAAAQLENATAAAQLENAKLVVEKESLKKEIQNNQKMARNLEKCNVRLAEENDRNDKQISMLQSQLAEALQRAKFLKEQKRSPNLHL